MTFATLTLIYEFNPYSLDVQIWTSYVKAFESYHLTDKQTDTTEIIYHAASRVVKNPFIFVPTIRYSYAAP